MTRNSCGRRDIRITVVITAAKFIIKSRLFITLLHCILQPGTKAGVFKRLVFFFSRRYNYMSPAVLFLNVANILKYCNKSLYPLTCFLKDVNRRYVCKLVKLQVLSYKACYVSSPLVLHFLHQLLQVCKMPTELSL